MYMALFYHMAIKVHILLFDGWIIVWKEGEPEDKVKAHVYTHYLRKLAIGLHVYVWLYEDRQNTW